MKLLVCPHCGDVRKLHRQPVSCQCGKSSGRYVDYARAEVSAEACVIGLGNGSLQAAVSKFRGHAPDDTHTQHGSSGYELRCWLFSKRGAPNVTWTVQP